MKSLFLLLAMLITSFTVYSEVVFRTQKAKKSGLVEQRQEKALEIRKSNFEAINLPSGRKNMISSLGFQEVGEADFFETER